MRRRELALTALVLAGGSVLAGCTQDVQWDDYAPTVHARIDQMSADGDCAGLSQEYNAAAGNDAVTQSRTGHDNSHLMAYIKDKLKAAGC